MNERNVQVVIGDPSIQYDGTYSVVSAGKYLRLQFHPPKIIRGERKPRNPVSVFSRRSRFRMLCGLSKVVWDTVGVSRFITVTYPDECVHWDNERRNQERWTLWRHLENHFKRELPGVWRVEWKKRKTGCMVGKVCPHVHVMVFADVKLGKNTLADLWQRSIGYDGFVSVDSQRVEANENVACYVAKYCGKLDDLLPLECVSYLSKIGRHYGWFRKRIVPMAAQEEYYQIPGPIVDWLQRAGRSNLPFLDLLESHGWTLIGDAAEQVSEQFARIMQIFIDTGSMPRYGSS